MNTGDPSRSQHASRGRADWLHRIRITAACAWVSCAAVGAAGNPFGYRFEPLPLEWYDPDVFGYRISSAEDLDHDGDLDVIIAPSNSSGHYVTLLLGQPGGGFQLGMKVGAGSSADPLFGDFTGDGHDELVVPGGTGLEIWPTIDRPPVLDPINESFDAGTIIDGRPAVEDLDGDGVSEILLTTVQDKVVVRWSDAIFTTVQLPSDGYYRICPVADHDADGVLDILVRDTQFPRYFLIKYGGGRNFEAPREVQTFAVSSQIGDLDGNGTTDAVYVLDTQVMWQPDFAKPGKSLPRAIPLDGFSVKSISAVRQLAGGPGLDLVFERTTQSLRRDFILWVDPLTTDSVVHDMGDDFVVNSNESVFARDMSGDSRHDLIVVRDGLYIFEVSCEDDPIYQRASIPIPLPSFDLHVSDFDRDGEPEIASVYADSLIVTQASGGPDQWTHSSMVIPNGGWMVDSADLDGDGAVSLIGTSRFDPALWIFHVQDGELVPGPVVPADPTAELLTFRVRDLDADGHPEIVVADIEGYIRIYDVDSYGTPSQVSMFQAGLDITVECVDLNGDTLPDLITGDNPTESVWIHLNTGGLTFASPIIIPVGAQPYWIQAADLDVDGYVDLVLGDVPLVVLWGSGGTAFSVPQVLDQGPGLRSFIETNPIDLDGDGLLDVVVGATLYDSSQILWQYLPRQFESIPLSGYDHAAMTVADLNADGVPDMLGASASTRWMDIHWGPRPQCPADLNNDCTINFFDASDFLTAFALGQPTADLAEPLGVWDFFDVSAFLAAFAAGCP